MADSRGEMKNIVAQKLTRQMPPGRNVVKDHEEGDEEEGAGEVGEGAGEGGGEEGREGRRGLGGGVEGGDGEDDGGGGEEGEEEEEGQVQEFDCAARSYAKWNASRGARMGRVKRV
ncbi:hypothetical protein Syun_004136 [Stephania yunnanensis]|uniref:Uncharacterized protein n=1 Tax=Stephania yunnanensis TaxID=152371 RepID=A0AAP0L5S4_9MAGN